MNEITIQVTLNGDSVYRQFKMNNLDNLDKDIMGGTVIDMIDSLEKSKEEVF